MWETLDVADLLTRREEATTSANAGGYQVPLGAPSYPAPKKRGDNSTGDWQTLEGYENFMLPSKF